ncbi:hypothetical protein JNJ66_03520 [Candidatus Saccharibacteria bacterium]|nr:hypothetical protein [Candidatus Saccharibacteria bacterium]
MSIEQRTPDKQQISILCTNYRGDTAWRTIIPQSIWFGGTEWHPEKQWLLKAYDVEKDAERDFAMKDIQRWSATQPDA